MPANAATRPKKWPLFWPRGQRAHDSFSFYPCPLGQNAKLNKNMKEINDEYTSVSEEIHF